MSDDRNCRPIIAADRSPRRVPEPLKEKEQAMPATNPRHSKKWYEMMTVIIRCFTTIVVEWIKRGGHF